MASIVEIYIDEIRKQDESFFATWTPGKPMKLGDIGVIKKNRFSLIGNLKDRGIKFKVRHDKSPMPYQFNSLDGIEIHPKVSGKLDPKFSDLLELEVGFGVEFSKKGKFFFKANEQYEDCIDDLIALGNQMENLFNGEIKDKNYVIINKIIRSPLVTILISNSNKSKVSLLAKADASLKEINIADVNIDVEVKSSSGLGFDSPQIVDATPFFGAISVQELAKFAEDFRNRRMVSTGAPKNKSLGKATQRLKSHKRISKGSSGGGGGVGRGKYTSLSQKWERDIPLPNEAVILEAVMVRPEPLGE